MSVGPSELCESRTSGSTGPHAPDMHGTSLHRPDTGVSVRRPPPPIQTALDKDLAEDDMLDVEPLSLPSVLSPLQRKFPRKESPSVATDHPLDEKREIPAEKPTSSQSFGVTVPPGRPISTCHLNGSRGIQPSRSLLCCRAQGSCTRCHRVREAQAIQMSLGATISKHGRKRIPHPNRMRTMIPFCLHCPLLFVTLSVPL